MRKSIALAAALAASICISPALAAPDGKNRKIQIENASQQPIRELYASPVTATTWEEDLLGERTLAAGAAVSANIDNGTDECNYDLKAVLADGKERVRRGINVCAVSKWVIADSDDSIE